MAVADDAATIRVTNLSEDTRETDLQDLFRPFGSIARIFLAKDKVTGQSKVRRVHTVDKLFQQCCCHFVDKPAYCTFVLCLSTSALSIF